MTMSFFWVCVFCWFFVQNSNGDSLFNGEKPRMVYTAIGGYELGTVFFSLVAGQITSVLFYRTIEIPVVPRSCALFHINGTLMAQASMSNETINAEAAEGWQRCDFVSPVTLVPMERYIAMYRTDHFVYSTEFWSNYGFDRGVLVGQYGRYHLYGGLTEFTYPVNPAPNNYWVDVIFKQETLSLPPLTVTEPSTTAVSASTSMAESGSLSSTNMTGQSSSAGSTLPAAGSTPSSSADIGLIGILVGVALFVQCVILGVAIVLFVKWKRLRVSTTPSESDELAPARTPAETTAAVYADASEVRSSSTNGSAATVSVRTHEYGSSMGIHGGG